MIQNLVIIAFYFEGSTTRYRIFDLKLRVPNVIGGLIPGQASSQGKWVSPDYYQAVNINQKLREIRANYTIFTMC
jgi:hypothetical protein